MSLKHVNDLETVTNIDNEHTLLVYQDNRLKKINSNDIFHTKEYIENNIIKPKNDIINSLITLKIDVEDNVSLTDLIDYISKIKLE